MDGSLNHYRILVSNPLGPEVFPLAPVLRKFGLSVMEFDSRILSWQYRFYMKPVQRLVTNFKKDWDLFAKSPYSIHPYREKMFHQAIRIFRPDILFIVRGNGYSQRFLRGVREQDNIKGIIGWWTKGSKWFELAKGEVNDYDLFFFVNHDFVSRLKQDGHGHCLYLPHAANTDYYRPLAAGKEIPIFFVGNWSSRRQKFIEAILPFSPIICGPRWRQNNLTNFPVLKCLRQRNLSPVRVNERYNQSRIVLNMNVIDPPPDMVGWFNQRVFDVPASGTFLLTEYEKGLEELYNIGEEVETFRTTEELKDKVAYYLNNEAARERIARKGYERVMRLGTWEHRLRDIFPLISRLISP